MFGFTRITKYDEEYLNRKKEDIEDLLNIKDRFEKKVLEYDEEYNYLKNSYETAKKTDYISLFIQKSKRERSQKSPEEIIQEALKFQRFELQILDSKVKARFIQFINEQLNNPSSKYHSIFKNTYAIEKTKYNTAMALYREIGLVQFIKKINELEDYLRSLNLIYSNFLAQEYIKLKQVRY